MGKKVRVKMFRGKDDYLEKCINKWLEENVNVVVRDIKLSATSAAQSIAFAMVIYEVE